MDFASFSLNIGAALVMGTAIGLERQVRMHTAGLRTNALVCVGAALFVSLSSLMDKDSSPTRIAAQVVSGIGFLGGGVILREGLSVRGLATAATLWWRAVGSLAGGGMIWQGFLRTGVILFIHLALRPVARKIEARFPGTGEVETLYRIKVVCPNDQAALIRSIFMRHIGSQPIMTVQGISIQDTDHPDKSAVVVQVFATERNDKFMNEIVSRINIEPCVSSVSWEKVHY